MASSIDGAAPSGARSWQRWTLRSEATQLASELVDTESGVRKLKRRVGLLRPVSRSWAAERAGVLSDQVGALERRVEVVGGTTNQLAVEVASMRDDLHALTHVISELHHLAHRGAPEGLPLLVGFLDRIRVDAETAVAASTLIERQLARLNGDVSGLGVASE